MNDKLEESGCDLILRYRTIPAMPGGTAESYEKPKSR
jgi:hypothetical protein